MEGAKRMRYKESGDIEGTLLIFLRGGGVSSWMWEHQLHYFTDYHCIAPDLPGHGQSIAADFSIWNTAKEVIQLIEEKGADKKVILIGFSLGSQVVIQILSMRPKLADAAMINSALVRPMPLLRLLIKPTIRLTYPLIKNKWFSKQQAKTLYIEEDKFNTYYQESIRMEADTLMRVMD